MNATIGSGQCKSRKFPLPTEMPKPSLTRVALQTGSLPAEPGAFLDRDKSRRETLS
jgi:hypothetical protein